MYLFGSALIKKYFPDFREPNDLDYLSNKSVPVSSTRHVEYYSIPFAPDRELTPNEIYTLKVSHVIYDIYWRKHMSDIRFLQLKGCRIDKVFLADLRAFWLTPNSQKRNANLSAWIHISFLRFDRKFQFDKCSYSIAIYLFRFVCNCSTSSSQSIIHINKRPRNTISYVNFTVRNKSVFF
jgi:hypothetical protein